MSFLNSNNVELYLNSNDMTALRRSERSLSSATRFSTHANYSNNHHPQITVKKLS